MPYNRRSLVGSSGGLTDRIFGKVTRRGGLEIIPPADVDKVLREQFEWMMRSGAGASYDEMRRFRLIRELLLYPFTLKGGRRAAGQGDARPPVAP
jgi:hypothetical protein